MRVLRVMGDAEGQDWRNGGRWFLWTFFGGMMPLWLVLLALIYRRQVVSLDHFAGRGEFALYTAALCSGSIYVIMKEAKLTVVAPDDADRRSRAIISRLGATFPSFGALMPCAIVLMVVSAVIFMMTTVSALTSSAAPMPPTDQRFVSCLTGAMLTVAVVLSFVVTVADSVTMEQHEFVQARLEGYESFVRDFDKLGEGS